MRFLVLFFVIFTGCTVLEINSDNVKPLKKTPVASYGYPNAAFAEFKPTLFKDNLIYFDGQHIRISPLGSLINYETLDTYKLRSKPEYFNTHQALAITQSNHLVILDIEAKRLDLVMSLKGPALCSPTFIEDNKIFVQYIDNTVQYIDLENKSVIWERSLPDITSNYYSGLFKPLSDTNNIYFSIPGGLFIAVDKKDGSTVWTYNSQIANTSSTLNVADFLSPKNLTFRGSDSILILNSDGYMHCVSIATGLARWVRLCGASAHIESSDSVFYTIDSNNNLIAFDEIVDSPLWKISLGDKILHDFTVVDDKMWLAFESQLWTVSLSGKILNKYQHDTKSPHLISSVGQDKILLGDDKKYVYNFIS